jgi:16S rRNA pseudouridine516 synthase
MKRTLERILQSQGFGTRRACRELIWSGAVSLAGEPAVKPHTELETEGLCFSVDGEPWHYREQVYLALHKPLGSECSRKASHHPSVFELLPAPFVTRGVQPVGRLDQDSTGLLLLSNDGAFIHAHTSPRRHVSKTYVATIDDAVTPPLIAALLAGVKLHAEPQPLAARACRQIDARRLEIVLEQGKYHQVKRMLAAAGTRCTALHRTAIGALELDALVLEPGAFRELDEAQLARLAESPPA